MFEIKLELSHLGPRAKVQLTKKSPLDWILDIFGVCFIVGTSSPPYQSSLHLMIDVKKEDQGDSCLHHENNKNWTPSVDW